MQAGLAFLAVVYAILAVAFVLRRLHRQRCAEPEDELENEDLPLEWSGESVDDLVEEEVEVEEEAAAVTRCNHCGTDKAVGFRRKRKPNPKPPRMPKPKTTWLKDPEDPDAVLCKGCYLHYKKYGTRRKVDENGNVLFSNRRLGHILPQGRVSQLCPNLRLDIFDAFTEHLCEYSRALPVPEDIREPWPLDWVEYFSMELLEGEPQGYEHYEAFFTDDSSSEEATRILAGTGECQRRRHRGCLRDSRKWCIHLRLCHKCGEAYPKPKTTYGLRGVWHASRTNEKFGMCEGCRKRFAPRNFSWKKAVEEKSQSQSRRFEPAKNFAKDVHVQQWHAKLQETSFRCAYSGVRLSPATVSPDRKNNDDNYNVGNWVPIHIGFQAPSFARPWSKEKFEHVRTCRQTAFEPSHAFFNSVHRDCTMLPGNQERLRKLARARAEKADIPMCERHQFIEWILKLLDEQDHRCAYCGVFLRLEGDFVASLERKDESLGHVRSNVTIIAAELNQGQYRGGRWTAEVGEALFGVSIARSKINQ